MHVLNAAPSQGKIGIGGEALPLSLSLSLSLPPSLHPSLAD
jgi:hypothetical protein